MFKKRCVKIGIILLVLIALVAVNTNIFAAINEGYYKDIVDDLNVIDGALDSKVKSSPLLDAIAVLVYAVGSLMEWILGGVFQAISGGAKVFPWADAILFNAIPLLDVNVFNPSGASLVGIMQEFVQSTYWTVFYLALSFMGIAIMVTAIKLVVSTIASDKAQYKQAIVKWIMGFIMLWGIHFFMSFVLYLNEGLVEYASSIAQQATEKSSIDLAKLRETKETDFDTVKAFVKAMNDGSWNWATILGVTAAVVAAVVVAVVAWPAVAAVGAAEGVGATIAAIGTAAVGVAKAGVVVTASGYLLANGVQLTKTEFLSIQAQTIKEIRNDEKDAFKNMGLDKTVEYLMSENTVSVASRLLRNDNYVNSLQAILKSRLKGDSEGMTWDDQSKPEAIYYLAADTNLIIKNSYKAEVELNGTKGEISGDSYQDLLKEYIVQTNDIKNTADCVKRLVSDDFKKTHIDTEGKTEADVNYDEMVVWYCQGMIYAHDDFEDRQSGGDGEQDNSNIISTLAKAFKEMAWTNTATSWKPSKPVIQGALLYAILVAQSLIFFISYAKRLFYIIILILMAPVIVVYDFFTKFSS